MHTLDAASSASRFFFKISSILSGTFFGAEGTSLFFIGTPNEGKFSSGGGGGGASEVGGAGGIEDGGGGGIASSGGGGGRGSEESE